MKVIAVITFLVLAGIAALHVYWGFGGLWPAQTDRDLIDTVIGDARFKAMPPRNVTLAVAMAVFVAAITALWAGGVLGDSGWLAGLFAFGAGLVFLMRGVVGFFFEKVAWTPVEPFATLNLWLYSPLCLAIGIAFWSLALRAAIKH